MGGRGGRVVIELPADPSVGRVARGQVRQILEKWGLPDNVVDRAILVASELSSNAFLHALPPFLMTVDIDDSIVRVGVRDSVALTPALRGYGNLALTGRGLRLVALSSQGWGVAARDSGKEVWAAVAMEASDSDLAPMQVEGAPAVLSDDAPGTVVVRFPRVPVEAYLTLQEGNDAVFRECALLAASEPAGDTVPPALLVVAKRLNEMFAAPRDNYRDSVAAAHARGESTTDLERRCDPAHATETVEAAESYLAMMEQLDEFCRSQVLLAEPPSRLVVAIRRWFVVQMRSQLIEGRPPEPFGECASIGT